jgi:hypothetical protein
MVEEEFLFAEMEELVGTSDDGAKSGGELESDEGEDDHPNAEVIARLHTEVARRAGDEFETEAEADEPEYETEEAEEGNGVAGGREEPHDWCKSDKQEAEKSDGANE